MSLIETWKTGRSSCSETCSTDQVLIFFSMTSNMLSKLILTYVILANDEYSVFSVEPHRQIHLKISDNIERVHSGIIDIG